MKRYLLPALAALALTGCTGMPTIGFPAGPAALPAPLANTTLDDKALETAWRSFDALLDAVNLLGDQGLLVPGTPKGKAVAAAIRTTITALTTAETIAAAGSGTDPIAYVNALREASTALREISTTLRSK